MKYMRAARENIGYTQDELGKHPDVRIDRVTIHLIEKGRWNPTPAEAAKIAKVLRLPTDLLLQDIPMPALVGEDDDQ